MRTSRRGPSRTAGVGAPTRLREPLEQLYRTFDHRESATDPIHIVRRFESPEDREVVGFCAAALAFGRVASVLHSIELLLMAMGPHPAAFVRGFSPGRHRAAIDPIVHRWIRGADLVALMLVLKRMLNESGSIEAFFVAGDEASAADVSPGIESFSRRALETDLRPAYERAVPKRAGVGYFFPRPSGGSACKRLTCFFAGWCDATRSTLASGLESLLRA